MMTKVPELRLNNSPERVLVAIFDGDQTIFDSFWAVFSSCVDKGSESSGIQVLRLESCLVEKVADALEGLDYSESAYN